MLIGAGLVLCVLSVPLWGGRLGRLSEIEFRRSRLALAAIGVQVLIISILPGDAWGLSEELHLLTYGLLGAFVWANRHIHGLLMVGLGGALNFAAIATNGGVMPADPDAIATAGLAGEEGFANSAPAQDALLGFLGDVFAVPDGLPFANVFSVGDVVILLGAFLVLHRATRSRLPYLPVRPPRPAEA
jgi:hypothetical protein